MPGSPAVITVYGIPRCDTVRRARKWLDTNGVAHAFHDVRAQGLDPARLQRWLQQVGWEALVNRRGTTWRSLPQDERTGLDAERAAALLLAHPTLMRRPVVDDGRTVQVGFDVEAYARRFS